MASVEVIDHDVVAGEFGELGVGGDIDGEAAGAFEDGLDRAGAGGPIVIVDAVDDDGREFAVGGEGEGSSG